jgi:hypothetical protein
MIDVSNFMIPYALFLNKSGILQMVNVPLSRVKLHIDGGMEEADLTRNLWV